MSSRYVFTLKRLWITPYALQTGDFNSVPSTLPMTVVLNHAGLDDAWASLHPPRELPRVGGSHFNPVDAISLYGYTYNSPLNSYSARERLDTHAPCPQGKRLDYILFHHPVPPPSTFSSLSPAAPPQLVPTEARVILTDHIPGHTFSYSDHFGVEATFRIELPDLMKNTLFSDVLTSLENPHLSHEHALAVLYALRTHLKHSIVRARYELCIFIACVFSLVFLIIGTAWSSKDSLTPLFVFLSAMVTWVGTTMFYAGLLYGRWEANALQNVIEEMELYAQSIGSGE
jgi:sphingomyelin phosphodiesterase 2